MTVEWNCFFLVILVHKSGTFLAGLQISEVQEMLGDSVNNLVKHFYKPEKEVRSLFRTRARKLHASGSFYVPADLSMLSFLEGSKSFFYLLLLLLFVCPGVVHPAPCYFRVSFGRNIVCCCKLVGWDNKGAYLPWEPRHVGFVLICVTLNSGPSRFWSTKSSN